MRKIKEPNDIVKTGVVVKNGTKDTKNLTVIIQDEINALTKKEDMEKTILPEIVLNEPLKAPIKQGDVVGTITYVVEDISYTSNVIAGSEVKKVSVLLIILQILAILFILYVFYKFVNKKGKKTRNYRK